MDSDSLGIITDVQKSRRYESTVQLENVAVAIALQLEAARPTPVLLAIHCTPTERGVLIKKKEKKIKFNSKKLRLSDISRAV